MVADICRGYQISQTLYNHRRDRFLEGGHQALTDGAANAKVHQAEIERLQKIIGKQAIQIEILKNGGTVRAKVEAVASLLEQSYSVKQACAARGDCPKRLPCCAPSEDSLQEPCSKLGG